jgi:collagen beta-1,O-galactosyltransferase
MERILPQALAATFTADWDGPFDGRDLSSERLERSGLKLFPWQIPSANSWWARPLKLGEIGCTLSHLACWEHAAGHREPYILVLEDDVVLAPGFLSHLLLQLAVLERRQVHFGLLYLGRFPIGPDRPAGAGVVYPGYSHCTFGYLLHQSALPVVLGARLGESIIPVDEFLPCLYTPHPRPDLRARFPPSLTALACEPPLIRQLPKKVAGSDTEDSDFADW